MRPHPIALVSLLCVPLAAQHAPKLLFNGVDLQGWHGQRHFSPYKLASMGDAARAKLRAEDDATVREHWSVQDGELVNDEGSCGSSARCYTFAYGDNAHTMRVDDALGFAVGDCVQVVMPLSIYFEEEQYNVDNNNWVSTY